MAEIGTDHIPFTRPLQTALLSRAKVHEFDESATEAECTALATQLDLLGLGRFRFRGKISPGRAGGWVLTGHVGARVTQACVATLAPVKTRIDTEVTRIFVPEESRADEAEIDVDPEEEDFEPTPARIDLGAIAVEALNLALPSYPRAEGLAPYEREVRPPGAEAIGEAEKPFAGLASLKEKMQNREE